MDNPPNHSTWRVIVIYGSFLVLRLHGGDFGPSQNVSLQNSTNPYVSLSFSNFSPHKSTQIFMAYVPIGLRHGLNWHIF